MTGYIEYHMPIKLMRTILKEKKNNKISNQRYLCEYVDREVQPLGKTIRVVGF